MFSTLPLRTQECLGKTPIIAITTNAFDEDKKMAFEHGMNAHLAKPLNDKVLLQTLMEFLSK